MDKAGGQASRKISKWSASQQMKEAWPDLIDQTQADQKRHGNYVQGMGLSRNVVKTTAGYLERITNFSGC